MGISRRHWSVVSALLVGAIVAVALTLFGGPSRSQARPVVREAALKQDMTDRPLRTEGLTVLRDWDARRARAWAAGDVEALAALYTDDSSAGATDQAMLKQWSARNLVVDSMRTQIKGATVVARSDRRLVLTVTDRVFGATAVGASGRAPLPRDGWSTRRITFRLGEDGWRVAGVRTD